MHHILLAAQPTALLTDVPAPDQPLGQGVISTLAYFVLSMAIFGIGFIVQDLLTPGKFRKQVFVDNLPNRPGTRTHRHRRLRDRGTSAANHFLSAIRMVEPGKIPLRGRRHQITAISAAQRHHSHRRGSH